MVTVRRVLGTITVVSAYLAFVLGHVVVGAGIATGYLIWDLGLRDKSARR